MEIFQSLINKLSWNDFFSRMENEGFIKVTSIKPSIEIDTGNLMLEDNAIQSGSLKDPSFLHLKPHVIFRPKTEEQLQKIVINSQRFRLPITFASGKTGLSGGYANYAIIVDLADLHSYSNPISLNLEKEEILVEQGVLISAIIKLVSFKSKGRFIFPIQPASAYKLPVRVGGLISSNASGITSGKLGSVEDWLKSIRLMKPDGQTVEIDQKNSFFKKIVGGNGYFGVILSGLFKLYEPNEHTKQAILYGNDLQLAFNGLQFVLDSKIFPLISEFVSSPEILPGKFSKIAHINNKEKPTKWATIIKGDYDDVDNFIYIMLHKTNCSYNLLNESEFQELLEERSAFALLIQTSDNLSNYIAFPGFEDILSQPKNLPEIISTINEIFAKHNFHKVIFGYGHINFRKGKGLLLHIRLPVPIEYFYKENYDKINDICETIYEVIITLQNRFNIAHKAEHSSGPFLIWLDPNFRKLLRDEIKKGTAFENPHLNIYEELRTIKKARELSSKDIKKELFIAAMSIYLK
ncbi:MAG: FAD-binding oxidoreductase [Candidatus Hodarchaeota archaeon]